jgi:glycopeptide antibiotics resistance protein
MNRPSKYLLLLVCSGYLFLLLKITLFRTSVYLFDINFSEQNGYITSFQTAYARANFIPFYSIYYYLISVQEPIEVGLVNVLGNIVLFIPFGFLLPLAWKEARPLKKTVLYLFLTSLLLEVIQLVFTIGAFDIDDTLLNTLGGAIGYFLLVLCRRLYSTRIK